MKLEVGKCYKTKGNWKAKVIWEKFWPNQNPPYYCVIHKPGEDGESDPICHYPNGKVIDDTMGEALPCYTGHPADLVKPWPKE